MAERGRIERMADTERLEKRLEELLHEGAPPSTWWSLRLERLQPPELRPTLRRRGAEPQAPRR